MSRKGNALIRIATGRDAKTIIMNTNTPKTLEDVRYQDNVIHIKQGQAPETSANRFFHELFDPNAHVYVISLFVEEWLQVYECYQDSGSSEYLYIVKPVI